MPRDISIGNGSLLILYDKKGLLRDLYFPSVGSEKPCRLSDTATEVLRILWGDNREKRLLHAQVQSGWISREFLASLGP